MRHRSTVLYLVLLLLAASPAAAQTTREVSGRLFPDRATSACIGQAGTPVCAAETLLACLARGVEAVCRSVGAPIARPAGGEAPQQVEYAIERVSVIQEQDINDDTRDLDWYKPGFTLVELGRRSCAADQPGCTEEAWEYLQVYLRPTAAGGFEVVTWRGESEQDAAPEIPENFLRRETPSR